MTHRIITPVDVEPVALAEARLQCKVDDDDTSQDARLLDLISGAREQVEHDACRTVAPQTLEEALDAFPAGGAAIVLEMPPVTAITSINYTDENGTEQTLATSKYVLRTRSTAPREIALTYGNSWPATRDEAEAVRIVYATGPEECPKAAKDAILIDIEMSFCTLAPALHEAYAKARQSRIDTIKVYGF